MDTRQISAEEGERQYFLELIQIEPIQPPARMGRPTIYSRELAAEICRRVACGEALYQICQDDGMPARSRLVEWEEKYGDFRNALERARSYQGEAWGERAVGEALAAHDKVSAMVARVRADTLLKAAARRDPARWGEARDKPGPSLNVTINSNVGSDRPSIAGEYTIVVDEPSARAEIPSNINDLL